MTAATDAAAPPSPAVVERPAERSQTTRGDWLFFAFLAAYAGFALVVLGMGVVSAVAAAVPGLHETLHYHGVLDTLLGRGAEAMAKASHHAQPPAQLAIDYVFSLFNLALAALLLWLRPRDRTARLLVLGMVGTAAIFNLQAYGVYEELEGTLLDTIVHDAFHLVATVSYVLALLLFPDGRLVPRWSRGALVAFYVAATAAVAALGFRLVGTSRTLAVVIVFGLLTPAVGVASQAYRYRRSRSPVEHQQGRLLFWALTPALLLGLYVLTQGVTQSAMETFEGRAITVIPAELFRIFQPVFAIIPIALFVGLLRFRLWNIERVISRTIVYGLLAGFVGAVYIGLVVGVGRVVGAQGDSVLLSVVATGVVAVAFQPARERAQRLANRLVYGRRATPYEVLSAFAERVAEAVPTEETLARMARVLAEGTAARRVDVWLAVGGELRPAASWPAQASTPAPIPLLNRELPPLGHVTAACPVRHQGELLGALSVKKPGSEGLGPTEEKLLGDLAAQAGLVLRNARLTTELLERLAELRASRQRLVSAQDEVRRRLERNIHDGAQQQLVALKVKIRLAERMVEKGRPVDELLHTLAAETDEAIDTLRDLARGIYPPLLAAEGLPAALRAQAAKAPLPVAVSAEGIGRYDQALEAAVYFCCLEALQNIAKYAEASRAEISLVDDGETLRFTVTDDGHGFDPVKTAHGLGLQNMADRVDALGGRLVVGSAPGEGTTVTGSVPLANGGGPDAAVLDRVEGG
ncbi:MAG TPA: ATP-binding protein [Egibacteraceae bacterium]|jgi:signal transduction histidine kinase|nr:ATP-binding protein [Egibacteraceae bacterium]